MATPRMNNHDDGTLDMETGVSHHRGPLAGSAHDSIRPLLAKRRMNDCDGTTVVIVNQVQFLITSGMSDRSLVPTATPRMNNHDDALTKMLMGAQKGASDQPSSVAPAVPTPIKKGSLHHRGYHAVELGEVPGIYEDKDEVRKQIQGFPFATWKSFKTYEGAQNYIILAFELTNQIRDQKDLFAQQELDRTLPSSVLRGQKTSTPSTSVGASFLTQSKACPLCAQDHLEAKCPQFKASPANQKDLPPKTYYAVAIRRKPGIYQSWGECHTQVNGFSGNLYQGFASFEEAYNFYITHQQARDSDLLKGTGLPLVTPSLTGLGGDQVADTAKKSQGRAWGRDPSTGWESKLFTNIAVRSEGLLIDSMMPDNISPQARQALTDVAVNTVAQPGALRITDNDDQTNTLTLSVATLANGSGGG
eukprot:scaffold116378_cov53-Attheya_sp.AAC.1